jgi:oligopeptide transport system permease protein
MEFVEAARAIGVPTHRIIFSHIVPNLLGVVVIYTTVTVPGVILTESVLSFLGLGIQEPMTSWGVLIHDGSGVMEVAPWLLLFPCALLSLTLYCFNFIGDGLRDALDPKQR